MYVSAIGTIDLVTGVETIVQLPETMSIAEAEDYCLTHEKDKRFWLCRPPTFKDGYMWVFYDYYIIVLTRTEQLGLKSLACRAEVGGHIRQSLRVKGLLDLNSCLTTSGLYALQQVKNHSFV